MEFEPWRQAGYWKAMHDRACQREALLKQELEQLRAQLRLREQQLFGRKTEAGATAALTGLATDPALVLLGRIVNGADTDNTLYRQPEGPGLEAIAEGFNLFNHTNFKDIDAGLTLTLNTTTGQVTQTNARFGQPTSARSPRVMQGSLRFTF